MIDIKGVLFQWLFFFFFFFDKKSVLFVDKFASGSDIKNENISNKELTEELHKQII